MSLALAQTFTVVTAEQRSESWFKARLGRLTGSRAGDMLSKGKGSAESAGRRDLRVQLVVERLTNTLQEDVCVNAAMQRGVECEPLAFAAYEALTGNLAQRSGFLSHNTLMVGCSLDGHIGDFAGILELKCPKSATHLRYMRNGTKVPSEHLAQITHNLWVSGAAWADFLSFDDRFGPGLETVLIRHERNEQEIASYALAAALFLAEVENEVEAVKGLHAI